MSECRAAQPEPSMSPRSEDNLFAVQRLRAAWESLPAPTPIQSYAWAHACAAVFPNSGLQLITTGTSATSAIAAFVPSAESSALAPLGHELYEPSDFAYADTSACEELTEAIVRLGRAIEIRDMWADSILVACLRRAAGSRLVVEPKAGHPWLELDDSWLDPESHLNSGRRSDLRRAQRNALKLGPVRCEVITPTPSNLSSFLDEAFHAESAGWKGEQGSGLATDPFVGGFYRHFAEDACQRGNLRIGLLRIADRAVAMQLAVEQDKCFWLFKMGFDESFARVSPGTLLMVESFRSARQRGCERYELMGRSEDWNRIWTSRLHDAVSLHLCETGIRGWVNVLAKSAKSVIKSQLRATPESSK